jgi:Lon protease-like protein
MLDAPKRPVPVFPLPGFVLFPHVMVPLHIFELRYRTMVRDALSGERLIALALLKPGWEGEYHASPEYLSTACLARIEEVEWLPNDCYDLKLLGLGRVELGAVVREFPYRAARVEMRPQDPYSEDDMLVQVARHPVLDLYRSLGASSSAEPGRGEALPYEALVNAVCMGLKMEPHEKHALFCLDSVIDRGRRACELAGRLVPREPGAPPDGGARN